MKRSKETEIEILSAFLSEEGEDVWQYMSSLRSFSFDYRPADIILTLLKSHRKKKKRPPSIGLLKTYVQSIKNKIGVDAVMLCLKALDDTTRYTDHSDALEFIKDFVVDREMTKLSLATQELGFGEHREQLDLVLEKLQGLRDLTASDIVDPSRIINPFEDEHIQNFTAKLREAQGGDGLFTGWERFDRLHPPLYPGEQGLFAAPSGRGKSLTLVELCHYQVITQLRRAMYVALDNPATDFYKRFITRTCEIPIELRFKTHTDEEIDEEVRRKYSALELPQKPRLIIRSWPRKSITMRYIRNEIKRLRPQWIKEDKELGLPEGEWGKLHVIYLDYIDLLNSESRAERLDKELENICNEFSALLYDEKAIGWNVSQVNRGALEKQGGMTAEWNLADALSKMNPVRLGIAMQQTYFDKAQGTLGAYVFKCTNGISGVVHPFKVEYQIQKLMEDQTKMVCWMSGCAPEDMDDGSDPADHHTDPHVDDIFADYLRRDDE